MPRKTGESPTNEELKENLRRLMQQSDLTTATPRMLRRRFVCWFHNI